RPPAGLQPRHGHGAGAHRRLDAGAWRGDTGVSRPVPAFRAGAALGPEAAGMWLGFVGVAVFALTLPMTRLATGTSDAPQLSPWFVTWARAALAGLLSAAWLAATRAPWPSAPMRRPLLLSMAGNVIGYPL